MDELLFFRCTLPEVIRTGAAWRNLQVSASYRACKRLSLLVLQPSNTEASIKSSTLGSTSFHYSFFFLPKRERRAISTVYAFCRRIDDIVDQGSVLDANLRLEKQKTLLWWRNAIETIYTEYHSSNITYPNGSMIAELAEVVHQYGIPKQYFLTLIDGCERDVYKQRYKSFEELKEYCYAVASIVGLISIEIFGYRNQQTQQYAINLGYALQLTNIIRDVKEDKDRGYIYIPQEDLQRFQYSETDLLNEVYDERFQNLMEFQAKRAREFYHRARTNLVPIERTTMVAAEIMDAIYFRLLEKIQLNDYQVFLKRIRVSGVHKFITALRIWAGSKLFIERLRGR